MGSQQKQWEAKGSNKEMKANNEYAAIESNPQ